MPARPGRALVVTDTVFSMDGDVADVEGLAEVCARAEPCWCSTTPTPCSAKASAGDSDTACLRVGTLSKALGSQGGYVAGPRSWIDLLINRARSFIFTTGLAPAERRRGPGRAGDLPVGRGGLAAAPSSAPHIDTVRPGHRHPDHPGSDR